MRSDDEGFRHISAKVAATPCPKCGGRLVIELRPESDGDGTFLQAKPIGTFSLAGAQMKISASEVTQGHPWVVCQNCKIESRGTYE